MASVTPILIGSGVLPGPTFALGHLVYVSAVGPPAQLSSYGPVRALDGAVEYTGIPNSALTYPAIVGATETFRTVGGIISQGTALDSIIVGRGAASSGVDSIAIGSDAHSTVTLSVVIGANALDNGQQGVVIGANAGLSASSGVAIGLGASVSGNAGGASGIAIGPAASAAGNSGGGGTHIAIGTNAIAKAEDVVIGGNASSNQQSNFGVGNVVIGTSATANVAGGSVFAVVIGWNAVTTQKLAVVLGSGAQATAAAAQNRSIVIGSGTTSSATDAIAIGGGTVLTTTSIVIGAGGVDLGAGFAQIGAAGTPITTILFGAGNTIATPAAKTMRFTNASGADNAAGDLTFIAPRSTGAAAAGKLVFQVGVVGASSSTLQTATPALTLDSSAAGTPIATAPQFFQGGQPPAAVLAGEPAAFYVVAQTTAVAARVVTVGYGTAGGFLGYRAQGTPGAPTTVTTGLTLNGIFGRGYDGTAWDTSNRGLVSILSSENWAVGAHGAEIQFSTTTVGTTTTAVRWKISDAGHFLAVTDNVYDIGATGATRPRDVFVGRNVVISGALTVPGTAVPLITTSSALTDQAGAGAGTLLNAPTAGNPTKWIAINDNGTTRKIPTWT